MNIKALIGSSLVLGCLMSASAFSQTLPSSCSVSRVTGTGAVFYIPATNVPVNVLVWGNGTGGGATTYQSLLTAAASRCVLVAAATTANAGSGVAMRDAFNQALSRFGSRLRSPLKTCTSGHSQGGGGSFNAANVIGSAVSCVIAVQPDTVFTVQIQRPVASNVDVTCIFSTGDTLAPASRNAGNCDRNATIYRQVTTSGTHFSPTRTNGGEPGRAQRVQIDRLLR